MAEARDPADISTARLLTHRPFLLYFVGRGFSRFAAQMATVALGWQVYDKTGSAFHLGLMGLAQFLPVALLVFVAGHAADRYDRQRVVQVCQVAQAITAGFLCWGSYEGWLTVPAIYAAVALLGAPLPSSRPRPRHSSPAWPRGGSSSGRRRSPPACSRSR
jgi:MFS family permease